MIIGRVSLGQIPALISQAPEIAGPMMDVFLRDSARTLISSSGKVPGLVQVTPPHHEGKRGNAAKRAGENAVMEDIWKVYVTPGNLYNYIKARGGVKLAAQYWSVLKNNPDRINAWLDVSAPFVTHGLKRGFDGGADHMARRDRRGRVRKGNPSVLVSVDQVRNVRSYIKKRQWNVGLVAAAIPVAYNGRFGALRGVPAWISRHSSSWASGFVFERRSRKGNTITVGVSVAAYEREVQRRFTYVLSYRLSAMKRQLPYIAKAIEKKLAARLRNA